MPKKATTRKTTTKKAAKSPTKKNPTKVTAKKAAKKAAKKRPTKTTPKKNENKTTKTNASVETFIRSAPEKYRDDARTLIDIMSTITKEPPSMWGPSMIGFGTYHYKYPSGREGDFMRTGFSPRKSAISLYLMGDFPERAQLLEQLGKHKSGKGCVYIQSLEDIHVPTLKKMIRASLKHLKATYG